MKRFKVNLDSGNSMWEVEARTLRDIVGLVGHPTPNQPEKRLKWFKPPEEKR